MVTVNTRLPVGFTEALERFGGSEVRDRVAARVGCNGDLLQDALQQEVKLAFGYIATLQETLQHFHDNITRGAEADQQKARDIHSPPAIVDFLCALEDIPSMVMERAKTVEVDVKLGRRKITYRVTLA